MTQKVISSILNSLTQVSEIKSLPKEQGIYAFFLNGTNDLKEFGFDEQIIYVGLAEKSLYGRDTQSHLATGKTGWSSFRRSLGAILKEQLNLIAVQRDKNPIKLRADKYKFTEQGELRLTEWMTSHLKMGYWVNNNPFPKEKLRILEEQVILKLKPTLDLDRRTRKKNPLADTLDELRAICRNEVKQKFK